jgi:deoxyribodipyrimidine photo-lyase
MTHAPTEAPAQARTEARTPDEAGAQPVILWLRRDLRITDQPALAASVASGRPVIPVFIHDEAVEALGAAAKWRLGLSLANFAARLQAMGSRLILRRGAALPVLMALVAEAGAAGVHWSRGYDPDAITRDTAVKAALKTAGICAESHPGALLAEPWEVRTAQGGFYQVYTPFWKALRARGVAAPLPAPARLPVPLAWPRSDRLEDWRMGQAMGRGAAVVLPWQRVGEVFAQERLRAFLDGPLEQYPDDRDRIDLAATSGLSENLAWGEISPRMIWHAAWPRLMEGSRGAGKFLSELVWRDFAWHLMFHTPHLASRNWRDGWEGFPWRGDNADAESWRRGRTGEPLVDAAMREMYVTGRMHNRARMIAASYLTKHLLTDWRVGQAWFSECLTDWDPAANALGWQWVAGSGPDAAPWFRIFNPATQAARFDPLGRFRHAWLAEGDPAPAATALSFLQAVPRHWQLSPRDAPPRPLVDLSLGRKRALDAYATRRAPVSPTP